MASAEAEPVVPQPTINTSRDLWSHALVAVIVAATGIAAAFLVVWWLTIERPSRELAAAETKHNHEHVISIFNSRIAELKLQTQALATAAAESLQSGQQTTDSEGTVSPESAISVAQFPHFRKIAVFQVGSADVDLTASVPVTFAALDLVRKAETQPFAGPEASTSQRELIYAAAPITAQGKVARVLFVVVDRSYFLAPLAALDPAIGTVELVQSFQGSQANTVLQWGGGGNSGGGDRDRTVTAPTANPDWSIVLTPGPGQFMPATVSSLFAPLALCLAVVLGGVFLAFTRYGRRLAGDLSTLRGFIEKLMTTGSTIPARFSLDAFQTLAGELARISPAPATQPAEAKRAIASRQQKTATPSANVGNRVNELLQESREATRSKDTDKAEDFLEVVNKETGSISSHGMEIKENLSPSDLGLTLDATIFRAYDIRGITDTNLTEDVVYWIGRAFAAEANALDQKTVVIGRDGRLSSSGLRDALANGLNEGGVDVLDIGVVPTPLLYYATHELNTGTGIMITGSHNPPEYNGLKMVLAGVTLAEERIQRLRERLENNALPEGSGETEMVSILDRYLGRVLSDVAIADPLKVVIDCGNGVAGLVAPRLVEEMGCEVIPLYCDVDGTFPNHHPDPAEARNLEDLITVVQAEGADIGLAFDGDGDRLGVVTNRGEIIWPDKLLMLFSQDIVGRNPGADIIYDVKCSRHLNALISEYGGRPIMWKTGHSHMKAKLKETGALLAGEFSGHICFGERWYGFDDALYSAARLLEIVSAESRDVDTLFAQFPVTATTPEIKIKTTESAKFKIMEQLRTNAGFGDGTITTIDGIRVDYEDGWGLIRPSNTSPVLTLRFEADGAPALQRIQAIFQKQLSAIDPALKIG